MIQEAGNNRLQTLVAEHRALDRRVEEMNRRRYLTPEEQIEFRNLKKLRLVKRDLITHLTARKAG